MPVAAPGRVVFEYSVRRESQSPNSVASEALRPAPLEFDGEAEESADAKNTESPGRPRRPRSGAGTLKDVQAAVRLSINRQSGGSSVAGCISENTAASLEAVQAAVVQATAVAKRIEAGELQDGGLLEPKGTVLESRKRRQRLATQVVLWVVPLLCSVWFAAAVFFPPGAQDRVPALLWTPGSTVWINGTVTCCPKPSLCSEGWAQLWLLIIARLSAFAMYPSLVLVFFSKCHATLRFLSRTFVAELLPLALFHGTHTFHGLVFASLALLHTVVHIVRWALRDEIIPYLGRWAGMSGAIGTTLMVAVTGSMLLPRLQRWPRVGRLAALGRAPFEIRFNVHYLFLPLIVVLCIHASRLMVATLVAACVWGGDYLYQVVCRTFRLDVVEFTRLEDGGVQVLWTNPRGFAPNSGEYVKIQIPWLPEPYGSQWHPFSLYLREATAKGLSVANAAGGELQENRRVFSAAEAKGGSDVVPSKTALLMIEFQNEFTSEGGKLHLSVKDVMESQDMLAKCQRLCRTARTCGAKVFHLPITFEKADGSDNPNARLGILKGCQDGQLFRAFTWAADFHPMMTPSPGDVVVKGKRGLDSFPGTDLEARLREHGIETVVIGGLLTNCCVESTMRTAFEKGYNTVTLTDGTACFSAAEQDAATNGTFKMFSTPMKCDDVAALLEDPARRESVMNAAEAASRLTDSLASIAESQQVDADGQHAVSIDEDARRGLETFDTTQIFVMPVGDWTRALSQAVLKRRQRRACWVRGPFVSPYAAAKDFSQLILYASGIGITPALGVMGQYAGSTRMKFLVWSTRSAPMLKFFAPLLGDAQLAMIFYTGRPRLGQAELDAITSQGGNIIVQQHRPDLLHTLEEVMRGYEKSAAGISRAGELDLRRLDHNTRAAWCALYCGGSHAIRDQLEGCAKDLGIGFQAELFDW